MCKYISTAPMPAAGNKPSGDYYVPISETSKDQSGNDETEHLTSFHHQTPGSETLKAEAYMLFRLSSPIALTALLIYSRSIISMLFLGSLGDLPLAAGSLSIAFANITGYSVLSGLSLGMEPLCSQAFGAGESTLLSATFHRSIIFLLFSSLPIFLLWVFMAKILLLIGQDAEITELSQTHLLFSLPDLISLSFIHPIRIYLRSQSITRPVTLAAAIAALFHIPANVLFVTYLRLGIRGVATAGSATNLFLLLTLLYLSRAYLPPWRLPTEFKLTGWGPLARLAAPSCASVCLEWWWYELMILLCGLLPNPKPALAAMGVLIQTTSLIYIFPSSLSYGTSARVGNELGANRPVAASRAAFTAMATSVVMGMSAVGFGVGMKDKWGRMFTSDGEILRLTAVAMPIIGVCELGNCPQTVGCGVLRGSARPAVAAGVNLGAFYLVGFPAAAGIAFWLGLGFQGLWFGLLAAQVSCAGLMAAVVGRMDWEEEAMRARGLVKRKEGF